MRHGGDLDEAAGLYGIRPEDWLDLSTGINPNAYPVADIAGLTAGLRRLPSGREISNLLQIARRAYGLSDAVALMVAPGTEVLIRALTGVVPGPVVLASTSYRSYVDAFAGGGRLSTAASVAELEQRPDASLIIVNPNNPNGSWLEPRTILTLARGRDADRIVAVDEAYSDAEPAASVFPHLRADDRIVVLKSFGKFFGLPGLRLGFAAGAPAAIRALQGAIGDWPVSSPAIAIGAAALADDAWQRQTRHWLGNQAQALDGVLRKAGLGLAEGCRLFRIVRTDGAAGIHEKLARRGIWTRVFDDRDDLIRFGLPATSDDLKRLAHALGP